MAFSSGSEGEAEASRQPKFDPKNCKICPEADVMLKAFAKFGAREGDGNANQETPSASRHATSDGDPAGGSASVFAASAGNDINRDEQAASRESKLGPKNCKICPEADLMLKAFAKFGAQDIDRSTANTTSTSFPSSSTGHHTAGGSTWVSSNATAGPSNGKEEQASKSSEPWEESSSQLGASSCPPDSTTLGRATWVFLHTMAAYYPEAPTDEQQNRMRQFVQALGDFYPCEVCAEHFRHEAQKHPPQVEDNTKLSKWFCEMHNKVNEVLGKPMFDCSKVFERWRDGPSDGSCD